MKCEDESVGLNCCQTVMNKIYNLDVVFQLNMLFAPEMNGSQIKLITQSNSAGPNYTCIQKNPCKLNKLLFFRIFHVYISGSDV